MLRSRSILTALVAAVAVVCLANAALAEPAIETVDAAWAKAMKANDIEAIVACYATDAVMWVPDAPKAEGTAEIRATYAHLLGMYSVMDVQLLTPHYKTTGDVSLGWGGFALTLMPKAGGDVITMTGRSTAIAEKRDGKWLYTVDHASSDPTPKEMPAEKPATKKP